MSFHSWVSAIFCTSWQPGCILLLTAGFMPLRGNRCQTLSPGRSTNMIFYFLQHGVLALKRVENLFGASGTSSMTYFTASSEMEKAIIEQDFGYRPEQILWPVSAAGMFWKTDQIFRILPSLLCQHGEAGWKTRVMKPSGRAVITENMLPFWTIRNSGNFCIRRIPNWSFISIRNSGSTSLLFMQMIRW